MPFERWDGRQDLEASRRGQRMHTLKRLRTPAFFIIGGLAAFTLYEQSYLTRNVGHSYTPSTNLGWQSFLPAYTSTNKGSASSTTKTKPGGTVGGDSNDGGFWDGLDDEDFDDAYGFQQDQVSEVWDPFVPNSAPLVEITAKSCMWPPGVYDTCTPDSSMREDAERGKWVRVEKDMNLRVGVCRLRIAFSLRLG